MLMHIACGSGTQTTIVTCIDPRTNNHVKRSRCSSSSQPPTSRTCNTHACEYKRTLGTCSRACGSGTRDVTVKCGT